MKYIHRHIHTESFQEYWYTVLDSRHYWFGIRRYLQSKGMLLKGDWDRREVNDWQKEKQIEKKLK